jgi:hypothetical protein
VLADREFDEAAALDDDFFGDEQQEVRADD